MKNNNFGKKVLYFLGFLSLSLSILCFVTGLILGFCALPDIAHILTIIASILGSAGLVFLVLRFTVFGFTEVPPVSPTPQKVVKTVDVKPIKKTREEELYEQYEGLYKENLITKEDLEKKRIELLGK